tara:strand:- start:311 stop:493 length:183 start_codon:yes stop_codon:yes gene_type:complete
MKYLLLALIFVSVSNCNNQVSNFDDKGLDIDIYKKDMTYEKFKQTIIEYADKASFPNLTN